jgi:Secretion system C-terminal sorting domain
MRRALFPAVLTASVTVFTFLSANAQNDKFAYVITDLTKETMGGWNALRKLDLQTGQYSELMLNGSDMNRIIYDATSKKELMQKPDPKFGTMMQSPFSTGVAAAAYDKKNNRLYFTPMFVDQLRYIDLKTMKVFYVTDQAFTGQGNMHNDEGKIITRMVIAPDGYGYAISNDGNTFLRFSTGKKLKVEQLGALVDDPANNGLSVHNRCTSFGGDMISDDEGNLYIVSARNHVFKVNVENKTAKHLGSISGLPANFTVNGAVVDGDGNLLVSSAVDATGYYVLNPKDWTASAFAAANGIFRSSDLANGNYLTASRGGQTPVTTMPATILPDAKFANQISVYPNPVTANVVNLQFNKVPAGNYTAEITDVLGRRVTMKKVTINYEMEVQTLTLNQADAKGVYMITVTDNTNQSVFAQKLVVQ